MSVHITQDGYPGSFVFPGSNGDYDLISYTTTDRDGYYRMVFPRPVNQDDIALGINTQTIDAPSNNRYSNTIVSNIHDSDIARYKIDFGERQLYRLENSTTLSVTFTNMPYQFGVFPEGLVNNNIELLNMPVHQFFNATPNGNSRTYEFDVATNQQIILHYGWVSDSSTVQEVTIPIGTQPVAYTINL